MYLNSVNYFSDFCESDGGDVASGQNIPRAKMLLFKGHDTFCQKNAGKTSIPAIIVQHPQIL